MSLGGYRTILAQQDYAGSPWTAQLSDSLGTCQAGPNMLEERTSYCWEVLDLQCKVGLIQDTM